MNFSYIDSDPFVDTLIKHKNGNWISFLMFVDSGLFVSVLNRSDAADLGLILEKGKHLDLQGVSGSISAYLHPVEIKLGGKVMNIQIAFSVSNETPRLLGRKGIFDKFEICFNDFRRQLSFS